MALHMSHSTMRTIAALITLSSLLDAAGQIPIRFDAPTNQWLVADTYPQGSMDNPNFVRTTTLHYFMDGDSLVGGQPWTRVFAQGTTEPLPPAELRGLVRQDGNVVLFLNGAGTADTLYDFGLQVGDSMRYISDWYDTYLPVVAVDSIPIAGSYRRVVRFGAYFLTLEDALTDTWIEGVGSIHGPLAPRLPNTLGVNYGLPDSTRTTCFLQDEVLLWNHPGYPNCIVNILLGVLESGPRLRLVLHPNPGTTLQLTGLGQRPALLRLLDVQGRIVHEGIPATEHAPVDLGELHPGTYLVEVQLAAGRREVVRWVRE